MKEGWKDGNSPWNHVRSLDAFRALISLVVKSS